MASSYDTTMNMNEDEDGILMYDDHEHDHDHDHEHHHHNLSRLSVCTTNSSKHSMYDEGGDDDMMMFMSNLSIDCDADEEEEEEDEEIVSGGGSSDSDKESTTCVSLPGTPQRRAGVGGSVEKIISHEKQYSSENEGLNKGGEKKIRKNSRRRIVRERWLDEAWEEKRCKAKAMMDHEEDMMMMMMDHSMPHHSGGGRRGSLCIDLEEAKACRDLGFEFEVPSRISRSCSNLDTGSSGGNSPIAKWKISSPGDDPKDVKARLKMRKMNLVFWVLSFLSLMSWSNGAEFVFIDGAQSKGAVCLDGSPYGYDLDYGFGSGTNSWIIQIEGGGWCGTIEDCVSRTQTSRGSSKYWDNTSAFGGVLSNNSEINPEFFNWNRVKLGYCDGASFTGDSQNEASGLYFRGKRIWLAVMEDLLSKGMRNANQALLTGCSAGGLTTILHCDEFRELFPTTTTVKCWSDGGFFLDAVDVSGGRPTRALFENVISLQGSEKNLPQSCTANMDPTSCFFPTNLINNIRTPLFILNSAYDTSQTTRILEPGSSDPKDCLLNYTPCTSSQIQALKDFRNQMLNVLRNFSMIKQNGLFINSCFAHCQADNFSRDLPLIGNKTMIQSVDDWYFDRARVIAVDCLNPHPCSSTCTHTSESSFMVSHLLYIFVASTLILLFDL